MRQTRQSHIYMEYRRDRLDKQLDEIRKREARKAIRRDTEEVGQTGN